MQSSSVMLPMWYRGFAVVVGLLSILLAVIVLVDPALGLFALVFLLAFALMIIGIDRLVAGITGHPFGGGFLSPAQRGLVNEALGSNPPPGGAPPNPPTPP